MTTVQGQLEQVFNSIRHECEAIATIVTKLNVNIFEIRKHFNVYFYFQSFFSIILRNELRFTRHT